MADVVTRTHLRPPELTMPFQPSSLSLKVSWQAWTRALCVQFLIVILSIVAFGADYPTVPKFRKSEAGGATPIVPAKKVRLLTDADFPPFSFRDASGRTIGLSVELALAACEEIKVSCRVEARSFGELVPALQRNEGDMIISGVQLTPVLLNEFSMTRPYFMSSGRFAVSRSFVGDKADGMAFEGKAIGVVAGSTHEAWLARYFPDLELKPFKSEADVFAALKTGEVAAVFGDGLHIGFWLSGASSGNCCRALDGPFFDRNYFSRNLVFLTNRSEAQVSKAFDVALDRLQDSGVTTKLLQRYFPATAW